MPPFWASRSVSSIDTICTALAVDRLEWAICEHFADSAYLYLSRLLDSTDTRMIDAEQLLAFNLFRKGQAQQALIQLEVCLAKARKYHGQNHAFLAHFCLDVGIFHQIKKRTGEGKIWLRSTGSSLVSQFLDSFVVVFIALYIGQQLPFAQVLAISVMSYLYKAVMAIALTPVVYVAHSTIDRYLGPELAREMKTAAQQ